MAGRGATKGAGYNFRHGYHGTPTYTSWIEMRRRCRSLNRDNSVNYSERGITVCARWDSFAAFLADVGVRPRGCTLDRIDGNRGYEPGNVRWSTPLVQSQNSRNVWLLTLDDERIGVQEMARRLAMRPAALYYHFDPKAREKSRDWQRRRRARREA